MIMKVKFKLAVFALAAALAFCFASCKSDTETEYLDKTYAAAPTFTATASEGGAAPTVQSTKYTVAITVTEDTLFKAIAVKDGIENSPVSVGAVSITEKMVTVTKEVEVEKEVEKEVPVEVPVEVPSDMTSHDAVSVYHYKQSTNGIGYSRVYYEENEDGTQKTDDEGKRLSIETAQSVVAGTKLSRIAKTFYGFKAKGLVESQQADGTYAVNVYYDRNLVTIAVTGGVTESLTGLYDTTVDVSKILQKTPQGYFISAIDIPFKFPAEDTTGTVAFSSTNVDSTDGFIKIPKGSFKRSTATKSETANSSNTYTITLTKDFYMCEHEVTQGEWEKYMSYYGAEASETSYMPKDKYGKGENYPVYYVNWYEAVIYCNLLSKAKNLTPVYYITVTENEESVKKTDPADWASIEGTNIVKTDDGKYYYNAKVASTKLDYTGEENTDGGIQFDTTANGYRLPTEAEWEYAALGSYKDNANWNGYGDSSNTDAHVFAGYDGTNADEVERYVWYDNSSYKLLEAKNRLPNSYGLYDMVGNVSEWCYDWKGDYPTNAETDPLGSSTGEYRIFRGSGSSESVARRGNNYTYYRSYGIGLRLVRSAE